MKGGAVPGRGIVSTMAQSDKREDRLEDTKKCVAKGMAVGVGSKTGGTISREPAGQPRSPRKTKTRNVPWVPTSLQKQPRPVPKGPGYPGWASGLRRYTKDWLIQVIWQTVGAQ